jgi:hypothetical protein
MTTESAVAGWVEEDARTAPRPRSLQAVEWWALAGVAYLLFWAYVLVRWVSGPYFKSVPAGPTPQATWMEVVHVGWQAAAVPFIVIAIYVGIVRPWRRTRNVPLYGLVTVAVLPMMFQDALPDMTGWFYTANSHLWNMGSFYADIPGWSAFTRPGAIIPWMPFFNLIEYPLGMLIPIWLGRRILRATVTDRGWHPAAGLALVFPVMAVFDFLIEGCVFVLLGFYSYPGGKLSLFPDSYHKFPLVNALCVAAFLTVVAALVYFPNDRGEIMLERGLSSVPGGRVKRTWLRGLALMSVTCYCFLLFYNLPMAILVGLNPGRWPTRIQAESYMTDNLCGPRTDRLCPGPGIPLTDSAWVDTAGRLRGPAGARLHPHLPAGGTADSTPFVGRVFGSGSR